jgi:hypothetical protein
MSSWRGAAGLHVRRQDMSFENLPPVDMDALRELTHREICFVVIELRPTDVDVLVPIISSIVESAATHGALVDTMVSNLMVVCFGMFDHSPLIAHEAFSQSLRVKHGTQIRAVFSVGVGAVGNLGTDKLMSFSFIHSAFPKALAELNKIPFGEVHEIR